MLKKITLLPLVFSIFLLTSCAFNAEEININPQYKVTQRNVGHGYKVAVRIIDERSSERLGGRASGIGEAADINLQSNLKDIIQDEVYMSLRKLNFKPEPYNAIAPRRLTIRIVSLDYKPQKGLFTEGVSINTTIEAEVYTHRHSYESVYRGNNEEKILFTPSAKSDSDHVSRAVSAVLQKLFDDEQLFRLLARRK
jgi:uncharacterized lipoprotein YajG